MLSQANHWIEIMGTAVDALLLCRVLLLKLQRVYLFITLACLLALFFDGVDLWLATDPDRSLRLFLYSRFLYAFLFPLVVWDVFEEMKPQISKIRRMAVGKLVSGLFFATVFGFLLSALAPSDDHNGTSVLAMLGLVLWAGSSTASLAFVWTLRRALRAQNLGPPNNTVVWMAFWQLFLLAQVLYCFCSLMLPYLKNGTADALNIVFNSYGIVITAWCILKLRALPSDVPSAPANANL
jgi:hypothetical protein